MNIKSSITLGLIVMALGCAQVPTQQSDSATPSEKKSSPAAQSSNYATFLGEYETRPNENLRVYLEEEKLKLDGPGQPVMELIPTTTKNRFFLKEFNIHIEFVSNGNSITKLLMIRGDGQSLEAPKIK